MGRSTEHHGWLEEALARSMILRSFPKPSISSASPTSSLVTWNRHIGISARRCRCTARSGNEAGALWPLAEYALTVAFRDGLDAAMPLLEDGIVRARAIGADVPRFYMELSVGQYMVMAGRAAQGREQLKTVLLTPAPVEHFRHWASLMLALSNATLGDLDRAGAGVDEPLAYARSTGDRMTLGMGLWVLTHLRVAEGRLAEARTSAAELETVVLDLVPLNWWASVMHSVAELALADGDNHGVINQGVRGGNSPHAPGSAGAARRAHYATKGRRLRPSVTSVARARRILRCDRRNWPRTRNSSTKREPSSPSPTSSVEKGAPTKPRTMRGKP